MCQVGSRFSHGLHDFVSLSLALKYVTEEYGRTVFATCDDGFFREIQPAYWMSVDHCGLCVLMSETCAHGTLIYS